MKKLIIVVTVIFCLINSQTASAFDEWTEEDTKYQLVYSLVTFVDLKQTRQVARNPDKFVEYNPFLGESPSEGDVNVYITSIILGNAAVAYILPQKYRRIWQMFWIGYECNTIERNYAAGIRITF
jgi:hypothetical protein